MISSEEGLGVQATDYCQTVDTVVVAISGTYTHFCARINEILGLSGHGGLGGARQPTRGQMPRGKCTLAGRCSPALLPPLICRQRPPCVQGHQVEPHEAWRDRIEASRVERLLPGAGEGYATRSLRLQGIVGPSETWKSAAGSAVSFARRLIVSPRRQKPMLPSSGHSEGGC